MADQIPTRAELMAPYRHPYRTYLPVALRAARADRVAAGGAAAFAAGVVATLATGSIAWVALGFLVLAFALTAVLRAGLDAAVATRRLTRPWDERTELGNVRAQRPHRGETDPQLVHDEYAVTVEDDGLLYVWRYTPLAPATAAPDGTVPVPGRPRYAARVVEERPFDPEAARAAEQLVETQARAAALEAGARDGARRRSLDALEGAELARETSSTAAALRHLTGQ